MWISPPRRQSAAGEACGFTLQRLSRGAFQSLLRLALSTRGPFELVDPRDAALARTMSMLHVKHVYMTLYARPDLPSRRFGSSEPFVNLVFSLMFRHFLLCFEIATPRRPPCYIAPIALKHSRAPPLANIDRSHGSQGKDKQ